MRNILIFLVTVLAAGFSSQVNVQCNENVVGTWKLVSVTATTDKGEMDKAVLGQHPSGLLTYYAGRYTFTCDKVVDHIEVATLQNWVNTNQTRFVTLQGNRMIVRNTPR
jgi:hypothetical protein